MRFVKSMKYDEYLSFKKTSEQAIRDAARLLAGSGGQEVLLAVGSVAEDLGNSKSDLDLLMISPQAKVADKIDNVECSWVSGDCIVDMQILTMSDVKALIARLDSWAAEPWDASRAALFSADELLLLHRLCNGVVLSSNRELQGARGLLPDPGRVARLKLHTARHMARTFQVDMVGYKRLGDWHSLIYASQDLLGRAVDGLLAAFQRTNPNPKWRSRLLHELPPDWARQIVSRSLAADARQAVWSMHYAPATVDATSALAHACQSTTFGRAVFAWAECTLVHGLDRALQQSSWQQGSFPTGHWQPLSYLELDVDFVITTDGVSVARLNEFGATLEASLDQFSLILQHDGRTTVSEAIMAMTAGAPSADESFRMEHFIDKVGRSGLVLNHSAR